MSATSSAIGAKLLEIAKQWELGAREVTVDVTSEYMLYDAEQGSLRVSIFLPKLEFIDFNKAPPFFTEIYHGLLFLVKALKQQNISFTFAGDFLKELNKYIGNCYKLLGIKLTTHYCRENYTREKHAYLEILSDKEFVTILRNLYNEKAFGHNFDRPHDDFSKLSYYNAAYEFIILNTVKSKSAQVVISLLLQEKDRLLGILQKKFSISGGEYDYGLNKQNYADLLLPIQNLFAFLNDVFFLSASKPSVNINDVLLNSLPQISRINAVLIASCRELLQQFSTEATTSQSFLSETSLQGGIEISGETKKAITDILSLRILELAKDLFQEVINYNPKVINANSKSIFAIQKKIIHLAQQLEKIGTSGDAYHIYGLLKNSKEEKDLAIQRGFSIPFFSTTETINAVKECIAILGKAHPDVVRAPAKGCKQ